MRRAITLGVAAAALAVALPLATVQAAPALAVHIDVETSIAETGGPFTASGPAVDAGLICPSGDTSDVFAKASGYQSSTGGVSLIVVKEFTCDDASGAFLAKLEVRLDGRGDHFRWNIVQGSGAYAALHGAGTGYGAPPEGDYDVLDVYDGMLANPG